MKKLWNKLDWKLQYLLIGLGVLAIVCGFAWISTFT